MFARELGVDDEDWRLKDLVIWVVRLLIFRMIEEWNTSRFQCKLTIKWIYELVLLFFFFFFFALIFALFVLLFFFICSGIAASVFTFFCAASCSVSCCVSYCIRFTFFFFISTKLRLFLFFFFFLFLFLLFLLTFLCLLVYFCKILFVRCDFILITLWVALPEGISIVGPLASEVTVAVVGI